MMCDKCWANNCGGIWCWRHPVEVTEEDCRKCEENKECEEEKRRDDMTRKQIAREIDFVDSIMQSHFNDYGEETHRALQEAVKLIGQEPKTGKLKPIDDTHSQCMECGAIFCITSSDEWEINYCPNCGFKVSEILTGSESEG